MGKDKRILNQRTHQVKEKDGLALDRAIVCTSRLVVDLHLQLGVY